MDFNDTMQFKITSEKNESPKEILEKVLAALEEKGYDAVNQLVGYFISGDPTYITSHANARTLISHVEKDDILEIIVDFYIKNHKK